MRSFNFRDWPLPKTIRVLVGVAALGQAWYEGEGSFALLGIFFIVTAFLNIGCYGRDCSFNPRTNMARRKDPFYEEIK